MYYNISSMLSSEFPEISVIDYSIDNNIQTIILNNNIKIKLINLDIWPYNILSLVSDDKVLNWYNGYPKLYENSLLIDIHHLLNISRAKCDLFRLMKYLMWLFSSLEMNLKMGSINFFEN